MTVASTRASWERWAACRGRKAALFFPPGPESTHERHMREQAAKRICSQCAVRQDCLDHALQTEEPFGIWGGLNENERWDLLNGASFSSG